jgi:hypothetical protein
MVNRQVESFNSRMRDELLKETLFMSLAHARVENFLGRGLRPRETTGVTWLRNSGRVRH